MPVLLTANVAVAQTQGPPDPAEKLMMFFYADPRPERLVGFFDEFGKLPGLRNWQAYQPIVGLFAVVFRSHPSWIDRLIPAKPDAKTIETLAVALRLSSNVLKSDNLRSRFKEIELDERLKSELAGLPTRLENLQIATPTHLDILWGAAFGSGDARYVRLIIDYFAQTANRSEDTAIDVAKTVVAMIGGPKEGLQGLRTKYGDEVARQIIYSASALWALQSNARQHAFVDQAVAKYISERSGTPAAKALTALRQRK